MPKPGYVICPAVTNTLNPITTRYSVIPLPPRAIWAWVNGKLIGPSAKARTGRMRTTTHAQRPPGSGIPANISVHSTSILSLGQLLFFMLVIAISGAGARHFAPCDPCDNIIHLFMQFYDPSLHQRIKRLVME